MFLETETLGRRTKYPSRETVSIYQEGLDAYERGDYDTALKEFRPLAEQGDPLAQSYLGGMYAEGEGLPKDYVLAHMWMNLAAAKGVQEAVKGRDLLEKNMTPRLHWATASPCSAARRDQRTAS